jgi:putative exosortase-associated protein (TIGR04073 family)
MRRAAAWAALASLALVVSVEAADRPRPGDPPKDPADAFMLQHNLYPACAKLGRGVTNTLMGWLEVPQNIQKYYLPNDAGTSVFTGAAVGLVKGTIRTGVGVYETVTFLIPYPEHYAPILPDLDYFRPYTPPGAEPVPGATP